MLLVLLIYMGAFLLFPIATTPFILFPLAYRFKYSKVFQILFVLGLSLVTLRYIPNVTDDAAYHYKAAYIFQVYDNVLEWFSYMMTGDIPTDYGYSNYPLFGLLLYMFSKTGTYSLVSFVVIFIVYYLYSSIILDIYKKNKISKLLFLASFITILVLVNIRYTTSGMRYSLAVALTMFLFYKDIENEFKFNKSIIFYIVPILIHSSITVFALVRIFFPLLRDANLYKKLIAVFTVPILSVVLPLLKRIDIGYLSFLIDKFSEYQITSNYIELFRISDLTYVYIGVFISILYIILYHLKLKFQDRIVRNFYTLVLYICLLTLSMIPFLTILDRFVWFVYPSIVISSVLLIANDSNILKDKYKRNNNIPFYFLILLCLVSGIIWNKKVIDFLTFIDYNTVDILTNNVFEYFSDLHQFSLSEVVRR